MKKTFYTPTGAVEVDTGTVTDAEWAALGLSREELDSYRQDEAEQKEWLEQAEVIIDRAFNGKQAEVMKRLVKRLIKKGVLS